MAVPVILDVDTGIDDALALMLAIKHPDVEVRAVTCVAGNTSVEQVVVNSCAVLDLLAAFDVPVAAGADRPLIERPRDASWIHGARGLGHLHLEPSRRRPEPIHAVELMRRELLAAVKPVTVIALAPLTNVALLLRTYPEVTNHIERIVFMGGSASIGNAGPVAEYNIWHDPEAAAIVLNSGVPLTMYGLDVYDRVVVDDVLVGQFLASPAPVERAIGTLLGFEVTTPGGATITNPVLGDAGAVIAVIAPQFFDFQTWPIQVELAPGLTRGQTVIDRRRRQGEDVAHGGNCVPWARAEIAMNCDPARVVSLFVNTMCAL